MVRFTLRSADAVLLRCSRFLLAAVLTLALACGSDTAATPPGTIVLSTNAVGFSGTAAGSNPAAIQVSITDGSGGTLNGITLGAITYAASTVQTKWLTASINSSSTPATLTLSARVDAMPPGTFIATLPIAASGATNSPQVVTITFVVNAASSPVISITADTLFFAAAVGAASPPSQIITITNGGSGTLSGLATGTISYGPGASGWLTNAALSGSTAPATLTLQPTTGALPAGTYRATVPVTSLVAGNSPLNVVVVFAVGASPSTFQLALSTFIGGINVDMVRDVASDAQGNVYIAGNTQSPGFPTTPGAYQTTFHNGTCTVPAGQNSGQHSDAFVIKVNSSGHVVWSTLIGGPCFERAYALEVDNQGFVIVAGRAGPGLPTTAGAFQTSFGGGTGTDALYGPQDGFVCKLKADGSAVVFCSYFGTGDDEIIRDVAVDASGDIYVAAGSRAGGFPAGWLANAYQQNIAGQRDLIVAKISSDGSQVLWATYLGGSGDEQGVPSIRVGTGGVYVLTYSNSTDAPTPNGAQPTNHGLYDMYLAKLSLDGGSLLYATYLGGTGQESEETHSLILDGQDNAYITGASNSTDFPSTAGVYQPQSGGLYDAFVAKYSPSGQKVAATLLGGTGGEIGQGIVVDGLGNVTLTGSTSSTTGFPVTTAASPAGGQDLFVSKLSGDLTSLIFSTRIGGSADDIGRSAVLDPQGNLFVGGQTDSDNWPPLNAFQNSRAGDTDGIFLKFLRIP